MSAVKLLLKDLEYRFDVDEIRDALSNLGESSKNSKFEMLSQIKSTFKNSKNEGVFARDLLSGFHGNTVRKWAREKGCANIDNAKGAVVALWGWYEDNAGGGRSTQGQPTSGLATQIESYEQRLGAAERRAASADERANEAVQRALNEERLHKDAKEREAQLGRDRNAQWSRAFDAETKVGVLSSEIKQLKSKTDDRENLATALGLPGGDRRPLSALLSQVAVNSSEAELLRAKIVRLENILGIRETELTGIRHILADQAKINKALAESIEKTQREVLAAPQGAKETLAALQSKYDDVVRDRDAFRERLKDEQEEREENNALIEKESKEYDAVLKEFASEQADADKRACAASRELLDATSERDSALAEVDSLNRGLAWLTQEHAKSTAAADLRAQVSLEQAKLVGFERIKQLENAMAQVATNWKETLNLDEEEVVAIIGIRKAGEDPRKTWRRVIENPEAGPRCSEFKSIISFCEGKMDVLDSATLVQISQLRINIQNGKILTPGPANGTFGTFVGETLKQRIKIADWPAIEHEKRKPSRVELAAIRYCVATKYSKSAAQPSPKTK